MHIIFVTCELATKNNSSGGLATFTANISRIFRSNGNMVEILWVTTQEVDFIFDQDITVHNLYIPLEEWKEYDYISNLLADNEEEARKIRINWQNVYKAKMVSSKIQEINKVNKVDVVHFANHCFFSLFMDPAIPFVTRISGFENIWFGGGDRVGGSIEYDDNPLSVSDKIEIHAMKKSPFVMAPSNLIAEIGYRNMGISAEVIESPFVLDNFEYDDSVFYKYLNDKKYLLVYGSLRYLKGIHVIAHMAQNFLEKYQDRYIALAGNDMLLTDDADGVELSASEYVKKHAGKCADRVIYVGRIVREQLYPIIEGAELCILPSRIENLSNSCIEAMALGKIVVATGGASYEQLIRDGENGYLCERDNPKDFLRGVETALSLSEMEKRAVSLNAEKTVERLRPDRLYPQYYKYYEKVIREWDNRT